MRSSLLICLVLAAVAFPGCGKKAPAPAAPPPALQETPPALPETPPAETRAAGGVMPVVLSTQLGGNPPRLSVGLVLAETTDPSSPAEESFSLIALLLPGRIGPRDRPSIYAWIPDGAGAGLWRSGRQVCQDDEVGLFFIQVPGHIPALPESSGRSPAEFFCAEFGPPLGGPVAPAPTDDPRKQQIVKQIEGAMRELAERKRQLAEVEGALAVRSNPSAPPGRNREIEQQERIELQRKVAEVSGELRDLQAEAARLGLRPTTLGTETSTPSTASGVGGLAPERAPKVMALPLDLTAAKPGANPVVRELAAPPSSPVSPGASPAAGLVRPKESAIEWISLDDIRSASTLQAGPANVWINTSGPNTIQFSLPLRGLAHIGRFIEFSIAKGTTPSALDRPLASRPSSPTSERPARASIPLEMPDGASSVSYVCRYAWTDFLTGQKKFSPTGVLTVSPGSPTPKFDWQGSDAFLFSTVLENQPAATTPTQASKASVLPLEGNLVSAFPAGGGRQTVVVQTGEPRVRVADVANKKWLALALPGNLPANVVVAGGLERLYVLDPATATLRSFTLRDGKPLQESPLGPRQPPFALAVGYARKECPLLLSSSFGLEFLDPETLAPLPESLVGKESEHLPPGSCRLRLPPDTPAPQAIRSNANGDTFHLEYPPVPRMSGLVNESDLLIQSEAAWHLTSSQNFRSGFWQQALPAESRPSFRDGAIPAFDGQLPLLAPGTLYFTLPRGRTVPPMPLVLAYFPAGDEKESFRFTAPCEAATTVIEEFMLRKSDKRLTTPNLWVASDCMTLVVPRSRDLCLEPVTVAPENPHLPPAAPMALRGQEWCLTPPAEAGRKWECLQGPPGLAADGQGGLHWSVPSDFPDETVAIQVRRDDWSSPASLTLLVPGPPPSRLTSANGPATAVPHQDLPLGAPVDDLFPLHTGRHAAILCDHSSVIRLLDLDTLTLSPPRNLPGGQAFAVSGDDSVFLFYPFSNIIQKLSVPDLRPVRCVLALDWGRPVCLTTGLPSDGGGPLVIFARKQLQSAFVRFDDKLEKSTMTFSPGGVLVPSWYGSGEQPHPRAASSADGRFFVLANNLVEHAEPDLYKFRSLPNARRSYTTAETLSISPDGRFCFRGGNVMDVSAGTIFTDETTPCSGFIPDLSGRYIVGVVARPAGKREGSLKILDVRNFEAVGSLEGFVDWSPPPNTGSSFDRGPGMCVFDSKRGLLIDVPYSRSSLRVRRIPLPKP